MWTQDESGRVHTPLEPVVLAATLALFPVLIIESDATIVVPLLLSALLECKSDPKAADAIIRQSRKVQSRSRAR